MEQETAGRTYQQLRFLIWCNLHDEDSRNYEINCYANQLFKYIRIFHQHLFRLRRICNIEP